MSYLQKNLLKSLISRIRERKVIGLSYWDKLRTLRVYSQERRRDRYAIIFIWKISQGLVSGYELSFTPRSSRTGRKVIPTPVLRQAPAVVRRARESTLAVKGAQLFNLLPSTLRNSEHGDIPVFKNHWMFICQTSLTSQMLQGNFMSIL